MRTSPVLLLAVLLAVASCSIMHTSPAMKSPLKEQLAKADTPKVEAAARDCLAKEGWKVDPVGGLSASGWNVINASRAKEDKKEETQVYVQSPGAKPRVTGGPDYDDVFWTCLGQQLGGGGTAELGSDKP